MGVGVGIGLYRRSPTVRLWSAECAQFRAGGVHLLRDISAVSIYYAIPPRCPFTTRYHRGVHLLRDITAVSIYYAIPPRCPFTTRYHRGVHLLLAVYCCQSTVCGSWLGGWTADILLGGFPCSRVPVPIADSSIGCSWSPKSRRNGTKSSPKRRERVARSDVRPPTIVECNP